MGVVLAVHTVRILAVVLLVLPVLIAMARTCDGRCVAAPGPQRRRRCPARAPAPATDVAAHGRDPGGPRPDVALAAAIDVPAGWRIAAQVLVGTAVGAAIEEGVLREFLGVVVPGALAVVSIIGIGVAAGLLIGGTGHLDHVSAVLGMVPGGVGEMVASATALHANVPVVASMHVVRLVISLAALPLMIRCVTGLTRGGAENGPPVKAPGVGPPTSAAGTSEPDVSPRTPAAHDRVPPLLQPPSIASSSSIWIIAAARSSGSMGPPSVMLSRTSRTSRSSSASSSSTRALSRGPRN